MIHTCTTPALFYYSLVLCTTIIATHAAPTPSPPTDTIGTSNSNPAPSSWSRQDIITLIGVIIAVTGILITLGLASQPLRRFLCSSYRCECDASLAHFIQMLRPLDCVQRKRERARLRLQRKYDEWLAFQEWMEMSNGRHGP
ncbi:hypothetical protein DE146DRAFT_169122 [Phaeosphaeria sp. MPI-PUGE-AT-0046c]|nr:hypothetical protein DE146DRAFT_169122 [Phaeosphaeria sp. MPI-PUGE-AT-0046c]